MERQSQGPPQDLGATSSGVRHEILGRLAVGGMAELYTARAIRPDGSTEHVVLKRILPHLSSDPDFVRMFHDEAHLARALHHPNIVRVHDIGQHQGVFFFTMEYVHGDNTRTMIRAAQEAEVHIPLQHVVQIGLGVATGLHYAHEKHDDSGNPLRIVHRDVSPTNILVSFRGDVKIVDFGIAKAAAATHITQAGMLKGKASYMSPEQCRADPVDRRSDVYAIGILLYEMTTLSRLFRGDNELAILHQILTGRYDLPSARVPGYPAELEAIIVRCLQQSPDDRYQTALEIGEDLQRFAERHGLTPSAEALGRYLLDLCGDKPYPWADHEGEVEVENAGDSATSPTSTGLFDEQDTKVNRPAESKTPPPRPRIAAAPRPRAAASDTAGAERSSTDRHRPVATKTTGSSRIKPAPRPGGPAASATAGAAGSAAPSTRPAGAPSRPLRGSPSSARRPATGGEPAVGGSTVTPEGRASVDAEAKAALASLPEAPPLRRPVGRGPGRQALPGPLTARQSSVVAPPGRTLPGVMPAKGTTLAGTPSPPQSRRTIPGADRAVVPDATMPAPAPLALSMRPVGLSAPPASGLSRTVVPGSVSAGAAASPARTVIPGASAAVSAAASAPIPASRIDTGPAPRVQEIATPPPAAESGVDRTMLIPSPEKAPAIGSGDPRPTMLSRTMHLDAGVTTDPIPQGPTGWAAEHPGQAASADASATAFISAPSSSASHESASASASASAQASQPDLPVAPRGEPSQASLLVTQRPGPSQPSLLVTQRSEPSQPNLLVTQRAGSGAARAVNVTQRHPSTGPGNRLADLDADTPRRGTPLWVPMLIVLVVAALAASAVWWLWGRGHLAGTTAGDGSDAAGAGAPPGPEGSPAADDDAGAGAGAGPSLDPEAAGGSPEAGGGTAATVDEATAAGDAKAEAGEPDEAAETAGELTGGNGELQDEGHGKGDPPKADGADVSAEGGEDDTKGSDPTPPGADGGTTKPRTKPPTKKIKKKPRAETPEPKPQIPGFWPGPVPP